jgi:NAD(P)-dependent dehydrogenase (short-subunit alcohol dehydrogenase family)
MNKFSIASFTNVGYWVHSRRFRPVEEDLTGRTVLVTGATGGIGLEVAATLSALGARVVAVGRDPEKLGALDDVMATEFRTVEADLSILDEVRRLADDMVASEEIDVLVNNVGVLLPEFTRTEEGLEKSFATNLAGHFVLTNAILPGMAASDSGSVVNVSSGGMYSTRIKPTQLQGEPDRYSGSAAYAQAKRAQVILTEMWAEAVADKGVTVNSMHPGWVATSGVAYSLPTFNKVMKPFLRDVTQGADTIVWLAASGDVQGATGQFWFDRASVPTHLSDSTQETSAERAQLWDVLTEVTGSDLELDQPATDR